MEETVRAFDAESAEAIAFVGETLGPLFLQDPKTGNAGAALQAFVNLEVSAAAAEWPFVEEPEALRDLSLMKEGLVQGIDNEDLVWEYRRLFIGPGPKPMPPWGSVYTDRECVVFGASTLALRAWMREQGIERLTDDKTPEDHIGLMLVLMAWIARNCPEKLDEYLSLHVLTWSAHFLEGLAEAAQHPFYEGLARLTNASLEGIRIDRTLEVVYPRFYR
ncbi:MAG: Tat proofreading chaperone DmsD [Gordonibacter sp.]|nr:Tat proofreading chaperone DmsD [Gordonibacter sp.]